MKRRIEEELPLEDDIIISINRVVVDAGVIIPMRLLAWHSTCKILTKLWNDRKYLKTLFKNVGKKTWSQFLHDMNGIHITNHIESNLISDMISLVDLIMEKIVAPIKNKPIDYKQISKGFGHDGEILYDTAVKDYEKPDVVFKLACRYMYFKHGWNVISTFRNFGHYGNVIITVKPFPILKKEGTVFIDNVTYANPLL